MTLSKALSFLIGALTLAFTVAIPLWPSREGDPQDKEHTLPMVELGPDESLVLPVQPGDDAFALVTRCPVPMKDPYRRVAYGLEADFLDPQGQEVKGDVAFELTDDRITLIRAASYIKDGQLRITARRCPSPLQVGAFRLNRAGPLEPNGQAYVQGLAASLGLSSLDDLSLTEVQGLSELRWHPVEAHGADGKPLAARPVAFGPIHPRHGDEAFSLDILPHRSIALNLVGPGQVSLILVEPQAPAVVRLQLVAPGGRQEDITLAPGVPHPVELVAGPQGLIIHNPGEEGLILRAAVPSGGPQPLGQAGLFPDPLGAPLSFLRPERVSLPLASVLPGEGGEVFLSALAFGGQEPLMLEVRSLLEGPGDQRPREMTVTFLDGQGQALAEDSRAMVPRVSPFETALTEGGRWVSEPEVLYLWPTADTRRIRVAARDILLLRALGQGPTLSDSPALAGYRWRYRGVEGWLPQGVEGRLVRLEAQVRPEAAPGELAPAGKRRALEPRGEGAGVERIFQEEGVGRSLKRPGWVQCPSRSPASLEFPPDPEDKELGVMSLLYAIPRAVKLEGKLRIRREDRTLAVINPKGWEGRLRTRRAPKRGQFSWSHTFDGGTPLLFVRAMGEGEGCAWYRVFSAATLPGGGEQAFPVTLAAGERVAVSLSAYGTHPPLLEVTVDKGSPRRGRATSTDYTRALSLVEPSWEISGPRHWLPFRSQLQVKAAQAMEIPLLSDLREGEHVVTVRNRGDTTVWISGHVQGLGAGEE